MFMAQVTGNPAIVVSTGIKYRGIPDYQTFLRYRDQLGLRLVVVASEADLVKLCGEPELPGPDPITLNAEQLAAVAAAAAKGAETGVINSADELAAELPTAAEIADATLDEQSARLAQ